MPRNIVPLRPDIGHSFPMMSYTESALQCFASYYQQDKFPHWEDGSSTDGVSFGIGFTSTNKQLLVFEGSHDALDWWRNFRILPLQHPTLGSIDSGLYDGIPGAMPRIKGLIDKTKPLEVAGHSRGGSTALYVAAELALDGYEVAVRAFNPPKTQRAGSQTLSQVFTGKDVVIIRVSGDPVSVEPAEYTHPVEPLVRAVAPFSLDPELGMKYHHAHLCVIGEALAEKGFYG